MKENKYFRNTALTAVLAIALAVCTVLRAVIPLGVLPELDIPNMVLISLTALMLDHYLVPGLKRLDMLTVLMAALTFGLLPFAAGFADIIGALKLAMAGGIVFTLTALLFGQMQERVSSGPKAKAALIVGTLGLYLAAQCFAGMVV